METALKLIIEKSDLAMSEAIACLRALSVESPVVQKRYQHCLEIALNDPGANWTAEDRAILAAPLSSGSNRRTEMIAVRLTPAEYDYVRSKCDDNTSISDYIRSKIYEDPSLP